MIAEAGVRLAESQLDDPIGYAAWCRMIARRVDEASDAEFVRELESGMTGRRGAVKETPSTLFAHQATGFLKDMVNAMATGVADGRDPVLWLVHEQALVAATRAAAFRDIAVGGGVHLKPLMRSACAYIAVTARACDPTDRDRLASELSGGAVDEGWMDAQASRIYTDVCCGRAAAWIAYCRHMGAIAAGPDSYARLREAQAVAQANAFVRAAEAEFGWGDVHATGAYAVEAQATSGVVDLLGRGRWTAMGGNTVPLAGIDWTARSCCGAFGIDELDCACIMPAELKRSMAEEIRAEYARRSVETGRGGMPVRTEVDHAENLSSFNASLF